jgi:hypothetical protein
MISDIEAFVNQLRQVINWTSELTSGIDLKDINYGTVLRVTNPVVEGKEAFNIDGDYTTWNIDDADINNYLVLLAHAITARNTEKKRIVSSGRILCFETRLTTHDGAPIIGSKCFFDESDVPPIDTWFYLENVAGYHQGPALFCWIPAVFVDVVDSGIAVEIMDSYDWLDEKDPHFYRRVMEKL